MWLIGSIGAQWGTTSEEVHLERQQETEKVSATPDIIKEISSKDTAEYPSWTVASVILPMEMLDGAIKLHFLFCFNPLCDFLQLLEFKHVTSKGTGLYYILLYTR